MNDPILEALNFVLESDLHLDDVRAPSASGGGVPLYSRKPLKPPPKNSRKILPSEVILGEDVETPCLFKGCEVVTPNLGRKENKDGFLAHLLKDHRLVIDDVDKIASLHKYIIYWKEKFLTAPISDFCVGFVMDELPPGATGPSQKKEKTLDDKSHPPPTEGPSKKEDSKLMYYMITPALPEDKELRNKLWNNRIERVLEISREEREQTDFSRQCFFCREVFTGNRSKLFDHMQTDHSFRIGKPDNIVFVEEFLELIGKKLNDFICLHCEKVFKDKPILRDHMRKKGHKRLNAANPEYNRYYIINYLEPGKDWKALEEEDREDERQEEEWTEPNEEKANIVCLFCSEQSAEFEEVLGHMKSKHNFDFLKTTQSLDFYQKVKVINFIRRTIFLNICLYCETKFFERTTLIQHVAGHSAKGDNFPSEKIWNQPEYFFPTYENDQFLVLLDKDIAEDDESSLVSSDCESHVIPEDLPTVSSSLTAEDLNMEVEYDYALNLRHD